jgi:hypothetical protein
MIRLAWLSLCILGGKRDRDSVLQLPQRLQWISGCLSERKRRYTEAIRECSIHNVVQFYCSTTTWLLCMRGCVAWQATWISNSLCKLLTYVITIALDCCVGNAMSTIALPWAMRNALSVDIYLLYWQCLDFLMHCQRGWTGPVKQQSLFIYGAPFLFM